MTAAKCCRPVPSRLGSRHATRPILVDRRLRPICFPKRRLHVHLHPSCFFRSRSQEISPFHFFRLHHQRTLVSRNYNPLDSILPKLHGLLPPRWRSTARDNHRVRFYRPHRRLGFHPVRHQTVFPYLIGQLLRQWMRLTVVYLRRRR